MIRFLSYSWEPIPAPISCEYQFSARFEYQDNDPDDPHAEASNRDSNKGIVDRFYKPYSPLLARMHELNRKMYGVSDVIDSADVQAATKDHQH